MRRVLFDLNVVLDVLFDRAPHSVPSAALWSAVETGQITGFLSAHCVTTLHYMAGRSNGAEFADRCVRQVLTVFHVARVDDGVLREAIAMEWPDFEDAVCASAAKAAGCDLIATRDPRGFRHSPITAFAPTEVLALMVTSARKKPD